MMKPFVITGKGMLYSGLFILGPQVNCLKDGVFIWLNGGVVQCVHPIKRRLNYNDHRVTKILLFYNSTSEHFTSRLVLSNIWIRSRIPYILFLLKPI